MLNFDLLVEKIHERREKIKKIICSAISHPSACLLNLPSVILKLSLCSSRKYPISIEDPSIGKNGYFLALHIIIPAGVNFHFQSHNFTLVTTAPWMWDTSYLHKIAHQQLACLHKKPHGDFLNNTVVHCSLPGLMELPLKKKPRRLKILINNLQTRL